LILGIHGSVRPGYLHALGFAERLGCGALQILPYRRHHDPTPEELAEFRRAREASAAVRRLIIHARYLPYLAANPGPRRESSLAHLRRELRLAAALGGEALIVHVGAYSSDGDADDGMDLFCESLRLGWEGAPAEERVPIWVENVPGGGRRLGGNLGELRYVLDHSPAAGVCLDTAHAFAYGYDLASEMKAFLDNADIVLGPAIRAIHLNDTQAALGSHRENHCIWGEGFLANSLSAFASARWDRIPAIVEAPPGAEQPCLDYVRRKLAAVPD
jgi:deoxyribonuclease-4